MDDNKELAAARLALTKYLKSHGLRKTPERFAILEHIFASREHFSIDDMHRAMSGCGCRVSRATAYNTVQLLVDAGLVRKHLFDNDCARYERVSCASDESHHHLICRVCGKIREVSDSDAVIALEQKQYKGFRPHFVALYVYGVCSRCRRAAGHHRDLSDD